MRDLDRLDSAVRGALGLPEGTSLSGVGYGKTEDWDSVAHMQLVVAIEDTFSVTLDDEDVIAMSTYLEIRRILRDRYAIAVDE